MTPLGAALTIGVPAAALIGLDAWLRWQDNRHAAWAELTGDDE